MGVDVCVTHPVPSSAVVTAASGTGVGLKDVLGQERALRPPVTWNVWQSWPPGLEAYPRDCSVCGLDWSSLRDLQQNLQGERNA